MNHDMKGELECILTRDCVSFIKSGKSGSVVSDDDR